MARSPKGAIDSAGIMCEVVLRICNGLGTKDGTNGCEFVSRRDCGMTSGDVIPLKCNVAVERFLDPLIRRTVGSEETGPT